MHGMVHDMAWWVRHDKWYGLVAMTWYMLWPDGHHMVYGIPIEEVCHGMWKNIELHALRHCHGLQLEWPMSTGGPVHTYRTRSQVEGILHACSVHTYSSCSLWAGIVNREIVNL